MRFRTARCPGRQPKGAYFTRGSGHNQYGGYTEDSAEYQVVLDRLKRKFANAAKYVPKPVLIGKGNSAVGIVSIGSCDGAIREALDVLKHQKIDVDYLRVKAFPFNSEVEAFLEIACDHFRGGAKSRCATEVVADTGNRGRESQAILDFELQRAARFQRSPSSMRSAPSWPRRRA